MLKLTLVGPTLRVVGAPNIRLPGENIQAASGFAGLTELPTNCLTSPRAIVAIEPATGGILALASDAGGLANQFVTGISG